MAKIGALIGKINGQYQCILCGNDIQALRSRKKEIRANHGEGYEIVAYMDTSGNANRYRFVKNREVIEQQETAGNDTGLEAAGNGENQHYSKSDLLKMKKADLIIIASEIGALADITSTKDDILNSILKNQ